MRFLLISLLAVLVATTVQAEDFKQEKVTLGKKKCVCDFSIEKGDKCTGKAKCDKKCTGSGTVELGGCSFTIKVKKGKGAISKCECEAEPTGTGTGSGEGPVTILPPPGSGSGSGEEPVTILPPPGTGSGSGEQPVPITGSGSGLPPKEGEGMQCSCKCNCPDGSGECDCDCNCPMTSTSLNCAPGFSKVCPMMGDMCPEGMEQICPMNTESRMGDSNGYAAGTDKGCQCVPDFLMALVAPGMPPASGRLGAVDRAMTKATIQVGNKKCKCSYEMNADNCKKSKIICDKKCSGKAQGVEVEDGMYMLDIAVKKGKVIIAKCDVQATEITGTGGGGLGSGSGNGGGGMEGMGSKCACVSKGMAGSGPPTSGPEPTPGTGSGSGSEPEGPEPTPEPGTGSGSGNAIKECDQEWLQKHQGRRLDDSNISSQSRIAGGSFVDDWKKWPWTASIKVPGSTPGKYGYCGAVLISCNRVVTAKHCLVNVDPMAIEISLGTIDRIGSADWQGILHYGKEIKYPQPTFQAKMKRPEDRQLPITKNDIAIIIMTESVDPKTGIRPISLPTKDTLGVDKGVVFAITGWGQPSQNPQMPQNQKLKEASLKTAGPASCIAKTIGYNAKTNVCIIQGKTAAACEGDSGDPMMSNVDGEWYLQGIFNGHLYANCVTGSGFAYAVNVFPFRNDLQ